jgi:hypothetical protein
VAGRRWRLDAREERLARFERWAHTTLQNLGEHPDHAHLAAYARWERQPKFARRLRPGLTTASSHRHVYTKLRVAVALTIWLHEQNLALPDRYQTHVDAGLAGTPARAASTRRFVDWLHRAALTPRLTVARPASRTSTTAIDHDTRLRQARDLLRNDVLELPARIGSARLLLYGQPVTRIVMLHLDQIHFGQDRVLLQLGDDPIELHYRWRGSSKQHAQPEGPWLFPGVERTRTWARSVCPAGCANSASRSAPRASARCSRSTASVPAPILAELLGYHDDTTNHWRRAAAGDWHATRASRAHPPPEHNPSDHSPLTAR